MNNIYKGVIKRGLDIIFSVFFIILLSPLLVLVAILVKINLGNPILFKQPRPGKNEKIFYLIKFRTMKDLRNSSGDLLPDSERLTSFGKFLRKSSLDELPELLNILRGEMSFLGPRPLSIHYLPSYNTEEKPRHNVRPGLSGLAQINGRNSATWEKRLSYDLFYVRNLSFTLDAKILVKTFLKVLRQSDVVTRDKVGTKNFNVYRKMEEEKKVNMTKEIGSDFHAQPDQLVLSKETKNCFSGLMNSYNYDDLQFTFSGRNAIKLALLDIMKERKIKCVYFPSYSCISMLQPFIDLDIKIKFYDVRCVDNQIEYLVNPNENCDIFFFMNYFGYSQSNEQIKEIVTIFRDKSTIVMQDITHNLFNEKTLENYSDYNVASLRKWIAIASGGFVQKRKGKLSFNMIKNGNEPSEIMWTAMEMKRQYLNGDRIAKADFLYKYGDFSNSLIRIDTLTAIDQRSESIIEGFDFSGMIKKRRENARAVYQNLKTDENIGFLFNEVDFEIDVPLFVPIIVKSELRDSLRQYLINQSIYLPIHWPEYMGANRDLKEQELSIVCDQRYNIEDMYKICVLINRFMINIKGDF